MGETSRPVRRAGRPQRLATDQTPLQAARPDVDARIGWLLATRRLYRTDEEFAEGAAFVGALADAGLPASRSLVSRWESGEIAPSYDALEGYERVLGLPVGELGGVAAYLRGTRPAQDPSLEGFGERVDLLVERAEAGRATAVDWRELAWCLASVPLAHLPRSTWEVLAHTIVATVPRAVGRAQLLYRCAVADLAVLEPARRHLVAAVEDYLADPAAQVKTSPLNLLLSIPGERSGELIVAMVEEPPSEPLMVQAISLATEMMARGLLSESLRARLGMEVLRQWRQDPDRSSRRLAELIAVLPEGLRAPLTDAASAAGGEHLEYALAHAETPNGDGDGLIEELTATARDGAPGDPVHSEDSMLPRLVRELLFHRDAERRLQATLVLAASPFAASLCDGLLAVLEAPDRGGEARLNAAMSLRHLAHGHHRMRLLRLTESPDERVAAPATLALAHLGFDDVTDQVLRTSLPRQLSNQSRATLFTLGMTGSPALSGLARSAAAPAWQRVAASWWETAGPAVTD